MGSGDWLSPDAQLCVAQVRAPLSRAPPIPHLALTDAAGGGRGALLGAQMGLGGVMGFGVGGAAGAMFGSYEIMGCVPLPRAFALPQPLRRWLC